MKPIENQIMAEMRLKDVEDAVKTPSPVRIAEKRAGVRQDADGRVDALDRFGQRDFVMQQFRLAGFVRQDKHPTILPQPRLLH